MTSFAVQLDSLIDTTLRKDSRIVSLKLINCIFLSISLSMAGLRFWVRFVMLKARGLDDCKILIPKYPSQSLSFPTDSAWYLVLLLVAVFFTISLSAASLVGEDLGLGNHIWQLSLVGPMEKLRATSDITKALYACYLTYPTAITFTKLSIMATYFRIFPPGSVRKITVSLFITTLTFWVASIFAVIFTCIPVQAAWDYTVKDIILCVLPIPLIWSLSIPKAQRLILLALFCGGALACISSILRLIHLQRAGNNINSSTVDAIAWSIIEVDTGVICASVAALRPLYRLFILSYTSFGVKKECQKNRIEKFNGHGIPKDQKSWLPCSSELEITMPGKSVPGTQKHKEFQEMPGLEKPGLPRFEAPSSAIRDKQAGSANIAVSHPNDDFNFLTNSKNHHDNSRRKTWDMNKSTPIDPSDSIRPAFPSRSYSAFGRDSMDQSQVNHPRAINIADSRYYCSPTTLGNSLNRSYLSVNGKKIMNRSNNAIFTPKDNEQNIDAFQFQSSRRKSDLAPIRVQNPPWSSSTNVSELRRILSTPQFVLPQNFSFENLNTKLRRETVCYSKC